MNKKNSLYRKMIQKKELSFTKRVSSKMDEYDKVQLNTLLKYIERFVIVMFDGPPPEEYRKVLDHLRSVVPIDLQNAFFPMGTTSPTIGNAIYNTAFGAGQMSLSQSTELKIIVNAILKLFEQYRQVSLPAIWMDGSSASTSPATSTLSEVSTVTSTLSEDLPATSTLSEDLPPTSTLSEDSPASSTNQN